MSLAIVFIFCGVVTGLIAAVGFVGACMKWRPLLVIVSVHGYTTVHGFLVCRCSRNHYIA